VRARLRQLATGEKIQFICDSDVAGKMDRVIIFADGKMVSRENTHAGIIIVVEKT